MNALTMASHDASLVTVECERCGKRQRNGLDTRCKCGHLYARYARPGERMRTDERPGARGRRKKRRRALEIDSKANLAAPEELAGIQFAPRALRSTPADEKQG